MVKHIVIFKLGGDDALEVAESFKKALLNLPDVIPCLKSIEVGINANPSETWTLVLTAVLETMADVDVYAKHPSHVAAAGLIAKNKLERACVDYEF
ncbi:MAG: Dabb family protein [Muribaculum sp.]|nr:Dabb family protein [Muribaculaceae bacterium]MCM1081304.1 Dabb family protein [Muribaculum sp.]